MNIFKIFSLSEQENSRLERFRKSAEKRSIEIFTIQRFGGVNYVTFKGVKVSRENDGDICERLHEFRDNYVVQCIKDGELL